jgi:arylsulfatase
MPDSVIGKSLFGAIRGEPWRDHIHGEHSNAGQKEGMHYLTDAREKYVWRPGSGEEEFFDLTNDPKELQNLAGRPEAAERIAFWRQRLIERLAERGDGFSDGKKLLPRPEGWSAEGE